MTPSRPSDASWPPTPGPDGSWPPDLSTRVGVPHLHAGAYTASKHAVLAICDVLRGELLDGEV